MEIVWENWRELQIWWGLAGWLEASACGATFYCVYGVVDRHYATTINSIVEVMVGYRMSLFYYIHFPPSMTHRFSSVLPGQQDNPQRPAHQGNPNSNICYARCLISAGPDVE